MEYKKAFNSPDILEEEIVNAYRLALALEHQFRWVKFSLWLLIGGIILLVILLNTTFFTYQ